MWDSVLFSLLVGSRHEVILLVAASLLYVGFRLVTRRPADWPVIIALLSLPISAALILWTAQPTRHGAGLDSDFLAFESGCRSLTVSFAFMWSIAWLVRQGLRRNRPVCWKLVLAICAGVLSALFLGNSLPLAGKPNF
jgi:hypothetical protein